MSTILTIIGARPQFIKASVVSKAIAEKQFYGGGLAAKRVAEVLENKVAKIL